MVAVRVSTLTGEYAELERREARFDAAGRLRPAIDALRLRVDHLLVLTALDQASLARMGHPEMEEADPVIADPHATEVLAQIRRLQAACVAARKLTILDFTEPHPN